MQETIDKLVAEHGFIEVLDAIGNNAEKAASTVENNLGAIIIAYKIEEVVDWLKTCLTAQHTAKR